jgi:hypothetical protein
MMKITLGQDSIVRSCKVGRRRPPIIFLQGLVFINGGKVEEAAFIPWVAEPETSKRWLSGMK